MDAQTALGRHGIEARQLPLPPGGFPIWLIDTARCRPALPEELLSDAETDRAERFKTSALRNRYIAAHAGLRILLNNRYGCALEKIEFIINEAGKTFINTNDKISFNISYSGTFVAIGLDHGDDIGVDIEASRPISDALELAVAHFTQSEQTELRRTASSSAAALSRAFLKVWVRKEAVVKAIGCGLSVPLNTIECGCGDGEVTVRPGAGRRYRTGIIECGGDPILAWARSVV